MPDANRARPASSRPASEPPLDPRAALAQQYLQKAHAQLAEEEALKSPRERAAAKPRAAGTFSLSIDKSTFAHLVMAACALTFVVFVVFITFLLINFSMAFAYSVGLPAGIITVAGAAYASICYLSIIESTSIGRTEIRDALAGGWREWFWTLPSTVGMLAVAGFLGWLVSLGMPVNVWLLIFLSLVLVYPVLQLSTLETGTPLAPVSLAVLGTLATRPLHWLAFYLLSFLVIVAVYFAARLAWHDPPFVTLLVMGPVVTLAVFVYAWLLGQLANFISLGTKP